MAQEWKEWYVDSVDGTYKVCKGTRNGQPEVSLYKQNEEGKFELLIEVLGLSEIDAEILVHKLVKEYDTEETFSKSPRMGKSKATDYN